MFYNALLFICKILSFCDILVTPDRARLPLWNCSLASNSRWFLPRAIFFLKFDSMFNVCCRIHKTLINDNDQFSLCSWFLRSVFTIPCFQCFITAHLSTELIWSTDVWVAIQLGWHLAIKSAVYDLLRLLYIALPPSDVRLKHHGIQHVRASCGSALLTEASLCLRVSWPGTTNCK